jgi:hypothetical protein
MNTTKMHEGKANAALSKLVRHDGRVMTKREFVLSLLESGYIPKTELAPELMYNRIKYNKMSDQKEQDEYYRRCTERTKNAYFMRHGSLSYELSHSEYLLAVSLVDNYTKALPEASKSELKHLFGIKQ